MSPEFYKIVRQILAEKMRLRKQRVYIWLTACVSFLFLCSVFYYLYVAPPKNFPKNKVISVESQSGLNQIANMLYDKKTVKSKFIFRAMVIIFNGEKGVQAGDYFFDERLNTFEVASRLTSGNFNLTPVKITFPEGITVSKMATILSNNLIDFDKDQFISLAKSHEGYFFPDTYFFLPNTQAKDVIKILLENFNSKIKTIDSEIKSFKKTINDVVIMASILESEARTTETREIISGILWKRLSIGMPLQVDAPFQYIIGKNTYQLTTSDLKFDSPYNTYLYKGLPPGAICNPGLDALAAAVKPQKTPYLYFLSDVRGKMYYAKTYEEHLVNKEKYLK